MTDDEVVEIKNLLNELKYNNNLDKHTRDRIFRADAIITVVYENVKAKRVNKKYEDIRFSHSGFLPIRETSKVINALSNSVSLYDSALNDIASFDKETQDILHALEMANLPNEEEISLLQELKEIRINRRSCKNFVELVQPLQYFSRQHAGLLKMLQNVQSEMSKIKTDIEGRRYYPRVKKDLEEAFVNCKDTYMSKDSVKVEVFQ